MSKWSSDMPDYDELRGAIPEAQLRQIEGNENHKRLLREVLSNYGSNGLPYTGINGRTRLSRDTFSKTPISVPKFKSAQERRDEAVERKDSWAKYIQERYDRITDESLPAITRFLTTPESLINTPEKRAAYIEKKRADLEKAYGELETAKNVHYVDELEEQGKKHNLTGFDKKGRPSSALSKVYRLIRGNGYLSKEGDFIGSIDANTSIPTDAMRLVRAGVLHMDNRSGIMLMPREVLKKIDPYFKDYHNELNKLLPTDISNMSRDDLIKYYNRFGNAETQYKPGAFEQNDIEAGNVGLRSKVIPKIQKMRKYLGTHISTNGLRNIGKSARPYALHDIEQFMADNSEELNTPKLAKEIGHKYSIQSFNELDRLKAAITESRIRRAYGPRIAEYLFKNPNSGLDSKEIARRLEHYDEHAPFAYDEPLEKAVALAGMSMFESPQQMRDLAQGRCYGDIDQFGRTHHIAYRDKIRKGKTMLVNMNIGNPPVHVTAELALHKAQVPETKQDVINRFDVIQVRGPNNEDYEFDSEVSDKLQHLSDIFNTQQIPFPEDRFTTPKIEDDAPETYGMADGGVVEDNLMKHLGLEENKLLKRAAEGETPPVLKNQAVADGFDFSQADKIISAVMQRMQKQGTGTPNALGKAHKPADQLQAVKSGVKSVLF